MPENIPCDLFYRAASASHPMAILRSFLPYNILYPASSALQPLPRKFFYRLDLLLATSIAYPITPPYATSSNRYACGIYYHRKEYIVGWSGPWQTPNLVGFPHIQDLAVREVCQKGNVVGKILNCSLMDLTHTSGSATSRANFQS